MKFTKIIATIGPSSDSEEMIEELIQHGVNIFRFNFKHGETSWHKERMHRVKKVAKKLNLPIATLLDLQGPSIRTVQKPEKLEIKAGERILLSEETLTNADRKGFSLSHPNIIPQLSSGQKMLVNDGAYVFTIEKEGDATYLVAQTNCTLTTKRNVTIPGGTFTLPVLMERDLEGLQLAAEEHIDFIALSFVRSKEDIAELRTAMKAYHLEAHVVSKIETEIALSHIDEIIQASDAIMIARGDLGVELPLETVPFYQKLLIRKCVEHGIPVITATQMLQSMVDSPTPTRAEVSDVAHAVYEFTDTVMLSAETATGSYPLETVKMMSNTVLFNEHKQDTIHDIRNHFKYKTEDPEEVICDAAYNLYLKSKTHDKAIQGFIVFTLSGRTARLISRYRPAVPVFAFAPTKHLANTLAMNFGVIALTREGFVQKQEVTKDEIIEVFDNLIAQGYVKKGHRYILLHGDYWMVQGGTSTVKMITV